MRSIPRRSPGLLLATGALVLSLGGTASALPGKNMVDKNDIKTAAVSSADVANGALKGADFAFGSVSGDKLTDGAVNSLKLLDGSVTGTDLQNGSVTGEDVQNESLTGEDIKNSTIQSEDVENNTLKSEDIQDNSLTGGDVQDNSITGTDVNEATLQGIMPAQTRYVIAETAVATGTSGTAQANCPAGERAIGGSGAMLINGTDTPTLLDAQISASMPVGAQPGTGPATGWQVVGRNLTGGSRTVRAYAICVPNQLP